MEGKRFTTVFLSKGLDIRPGLQASSSFDRFTLTIVTAHRSAEEARHPE